MGSDTASPRGDQQHQSLSGDNTGQEFQQTSEPGSAQCASSKITSTAWARPRLDRLRDSGEQLRLGCEPAKIKEVSLAQQLRQHLPPRPVRRHVRRRAATPGHIEARLPSHRLRSFGEAGLADAWLAEHDRHPSPTDPGVPDQSRHCGQFLLTTYQGLFLDAPHHGVRQSTGSATFQPIMMYSSSAERAGVRTRGSAGRRPHRQPSSGARWRSTLSRMCAL